MILLEKHTHDLSYLQSLTKYPPSCLSSSELARRTRHLANFLILYYYCTTTLQGPCNCEDPIYQETLRITTPLLSSIFHRACHHDLILFYKLQPNCNRHLTATKIPKSQNGLSYVRLLNCDVPLTSRLLPAYFLLGY